MTITTQNTVILIDDDPEDIELMVDAIKEVDGSIECISYTDPIEAVRVLLEPTYEPRYILIDIYMPLMKGDLCLTLLRRSSRLDKVRIGIVSATMPQDDVAKFRAAGADFALEKPLSMHGYCEMVKEIFSQRDEAKQ